MSLFEECKEALKDDFQICENTEEVLFKLKKYPMSLNFILWSHMHFKDFDDMALLTEEVQDYQNEKVFVIADDNDIPIFSSSLKTIIENIYDVMALSPKVIIFNEKIILEPLFPSYTMRVSFDILPPLSTSPSGGF